MWHLETSTGRLWILDPLPATVGSARTADVVLPHASIAPAHARLAPGPPGTLQVDALGDARVVVDGQPVRRAHLHPGDILTLGQLRFTVSRLESGHSPQQRPVPERPLRFSAREHRRGWLGTDWSQLVFGQRVVLILALLVLGALIFLGADALVEALT